MSLSFFAINAGLSSISTPLTNALNAIGKIKVTLYLMVFWTVATWIMTPLFIYFYGFNGVAIASAIISFSVVGVVYLAKKYINFDIFKVTSGPFMATLFMSVIVYFLSPFIIKNIFTFLLMTVIGVILYFGAVFILAKKQILTDIALVRENIKK